MADWADGKIWTNRLFFVLLAFMLIILDLVPLNMRPSLWAAPDILLVATLVWVARRPSYLPVAMIAGIILLTDFLFLRPPGLWTALVVILSETIRRQHREFRTMPFFTEWGTIAMGIVAITLANRIILAVVMAPQAPLALTLIEMVATILAYPLVLVAAHFIFGVSKVAPGKIDSRGQVL